MTLTLGNKMKSIVRYFKSLNKESGNSLAEFAVTTAMMATLATTAAPKFSGVGEGAKEKKTLLILTRLLLHPITFIMTKFHWKVVDVFQVKLGSTKAFL